MKNYLREKKIKAVMNIHILGNSPNMDELSHYVKKNNLFLIEDTCEALGSKFKSKYLGTFGDFGTYSFAILIKLLQEKVVWLFVKLKRIMIYFIQ